MTSEVTKNSQKLQTLDKGIKNMSNQRDKAQAQLESIIDEFRKHSLKAQSHAELTHTPLRNLKEFKLSLKK